MSSESNNYNNWLGLLSGPLTRRASERLAIIALEQTQSIEYLFSIVRRGDQINASRASWVLGHLWDFNPTSLAPFMDEIVDIIITTANQSVRRNFLRIVADSEPETTVLMNLFEHCIQWMISEQHAVAVRCNAMQILYLACKNEPGFSQEVKTYIEACVEYGSAGFRSRAKAIAKQLTLMEQNAIAK